MTTAHATPEVHLSPSAGAVYRRHVVLADAVMSGASGLVLVAGAPVLDEQLGLPAAALVGLGLFYLAYAARLVWIVRQGARGGAVRRVAIGNLAWAVLSMIVALTDALTLTTAGTVLVVVQALAVAGLGLLQLRRARRRSPQVS